MHAHVHHEGQVRANGAVNTSKPVQTSFPFFATCKPPMPASRQDVLRMDDEAQAVRVALGNRKAYAVAEAMGISKTMLSLCCKGERRIPDRLLDAFAYLTGTTLLTQYRQLQEDLAAVDEQRALEKRWASQLPRAAA